MEPVSRLLIVAFVALLAHVGMGCTRSSKQASISLELSPARWPQQARDRYLALQGLSYNDVPKRLDKVAVSSKGMITGTSEPFAVHAGLEALRRGGSAADAALTTALAQVALTAGSTISYAGIMTVVYYDASTAETYTLNAGYNTVQEEKDPGTIPVMDFHSGQRRRIGQMSSDADQLARMKLPVQALVDTRARPELFATAMREESAQVAVAIAALKKSEHPQK